MNLLIIVFLGCSIFSDLGVGIFVVGLSKFGKNLIEKKFINKVVIFCLIYVGFILYFYNLLFVVF